MGSGLVLICLLAWCYLLAGSGDTSHADMAMPMAGDGVHWDAARWTVMLLMWWIMMIAMMVPSAAPMVLLYAEVYRKGQRDGRLASPIVPTAAFAGGYLLAWLAFSVAAVLLHYGLEASGLVQGMMIWSTSERLSGAFLALAGLYQFSPWKERCLAHCRSPVAFLSSHWRASVGGAVRMGVDHGLWCIGCCWSLMLLLFVGGVMNLAWVAALAALVLAEKLLPFGRWIARAAGIAMIAAGAWLLLAMPFRAA